MKTIGIVTTWYERGSSYVSLNYKKILEQQFLQRSRHLASAISGVPASELPVE